MSNSDVLTNFCTAITSAFTAVDGSGNHNNFYNSVQGRLFKGRASAKTPLPYSVFFIVTHTTDRDFSDDLRDLVIQFSHFSSDPESSAEVELINAYCNDLFDEIERRESLTIAGAKLIWMRMNSSPGAQADDITTLEGAAEGWHCPTDFEVKLSVD